MQSFRRALDLPPYLPLASGYTYFSLNGGGTCEGSNAEDVSVLTRYGAGSAADCSSRCTGDGSKWRGGSVAGGRFFNLYRVGAGGACVRSCLRLLCMRSLRHRTCAAGCCKDRLHYFEHLLIARLSFVQP